MASEAGTEVHHKAGAKVVLDAGVELTISGGGSFIKLDPSGVTLSGPGIKINSGGAPGSGSGTVPASADLPQIIERDRPTNSPRTELAIANTRQNVAGSSEQIDKLKGGGRKLIVDVIGGNLERDTVEVIKGASEEGVV